MSWVQRFLDGCKSQGLSVNTLEAYEQRLSAFTEFIGSEDVSNVSRATLMDFVHALVDQGKSASSVRSYIATLRSLGKFIEEELFDSDKGWRNAYATLRYPRLPQRHPETIEHEAVVKMFHAMPKRTPTAKRNYALVMLAYTSGLRASEIADLLVEDVDLQERTVFVRCGKGGIERYSFISPEAAEAMRAYLKVRAKFKTAEVSNLLWVGKQSTGLGRNQVLEIVKAAGARIGAKVTPHTLRRSLATHLRNQGLPVDMVQMLLGHASPTTTLKHYISVDPSKMRDMIEGAL